MFVLDTNVVSELRRRQRISPEVRAWANGLPASSMFLSAITILELERGVLSIARRDPAQGAILRAWIDGQVLPRFEGRILPVDTDVAKRCARLQVPDPRPDRDCMIAATALVHGMTVVTRNTADFVPMGVPVIDPWVSARA